MLKERLKILILYIEELKILLLYCMSERIDIMKLLIIKLENRIVLDLNEEIDNVVFMLFFKNLLSY